MNLKFYSNLRLDGADSVRILFQILFLVFCQTIISVGNSLSSYLLGSTVDAAEEGTGFYKTIIFYSIVVLAVGAVILVREWIRCYTLNRFQQHLRYALVDGVFKADLQEQGRQKHGEYYAVIENQVNELSYDTVQIVLKITEILISVVVTMYLIFSCSRGMAGCVMLIFPILAFCSIKAMGAATKTHAVRQEADRHFFGVVSETRSLLKELHILPMAGIFRNRYRKISKEKYDADLQHKRAVFFCRGVEKAATTAGVLLVLGIGFYEYCRGNMSLGQILASIGYAEILLSELTQINYIYDMKVSNLELSRNMEKIIKSKDFDDSGAEFSEPIKQIDIEEISFAYEGGETIFKNLSVSLYPGTITVLLGSSGAGKSTLLNLFVKRILLRQGNGRILFNGISLDEIDGKSLREHTAYLMQNPFFFDGTVYENLAWSVSRLNEKDAESILEQVGLDYLTLDTPICQGGINLSGGERQRLAFARCIAKEADVFILDEPFAQIDEANEKLILDYITKTKDKIFLLTTHKLNICKYADQIIRLEKKAEASERRSR